MNIYTFLEYCNKEESTQEREASLRKFAEEM